MYCGNVEVSKVDDKASQALDKRGRSEECPSRQAPAKDLVRVETKNAIYLMSFERQHVRISRIGATGHIHECDAFVPETGDGTYLDIGTRLGEAFPETQELVLKNSLLDQPRPIFYGDVPARIGYWKWALVDSIPLIVSQATVALLAGMASLYAIPFAIPCALGMLTVLGGNKRLAKPIGYLELGRFYSSDSFRSAICAEKMEDFIAPALQERLGRKPVILTEYGGGHV